MPLVSVIIPVYNVEKYLARCLNSVLNQTLQDIEIICVNDGSTDDSTAILDTYAKKSPKIKVLSQKNQGQSMARNNGLKAAKGEFIAFVDSDDFIDADFLKDLVEAANKTHSEIVMTGTRYCTPTNTEEKKPHCGIYHAFRDKICYLPHGGSCDKIYQKSFLDEHNLTFPNGLLFEDNLFVIQALYYCQSFSIIDGSKYNYCVNSCSSTFNSAKAQQRKNDSLLILEMIWNFISPKCGYIDKLCILRFCCNNFIPLLFLEDKEYCKKLYDIVKFNPIILARRFKIHKRHIIKSIPKFFWQIISYMMFDIKAQRKNFYQGISLIGFKEYMRLKKIIPAELEENKDYKYNVSIVAIAKNEGIYFKEWIEYHKLIGIEHFYIYNNESTDNTKEVLAPYIKSGLVTFIDFPGKEQQGPAYNDAIKKYKNETRWLCSLDLDEYIFLKKHNNINDFMASFKDCFQVSLQWVFFGSSGHIKEPKGLVIENFTKHAKECSTTPKSIFNPRAVIDVMPVHCAIGVGKWVNEHHKLFDYRKTTVDIAQINHYFVKSKDEFINRKIARGTTYEKHKILDAEKKFAQYDLNDVDDNLMQKYANKLKSIIGH